VTPALPDNLDHLLYACATLEQGMDEIESLLGVRPIIGGRHPSFGTHNALLSLGATTYLEIIARDPDAAVPPGGFLVDIAAGEPSRVATWALRREDIDDAVAAAAVVGVSLGRVEEGSRTTLDNRIIRWRLSDPYADRMGGALPFLISWGDTRHPATVAPAGGILAALAIRHPQADDLRRALATLGAGVDIGPAPRCRITACIDTPGGRVTLG